MMIEQLQLLIIFPLLGTVFPSDIMIFFRDIRHFLFNLSWVGFQYTLFKDYGFYHRVLNMRLLGFSSGSATVNIINWIMIINVLIVFNLVFHYIWGILFNRNRKGFLVNPLWRLSKWMFPGMYIKYTNLGYLMILVASIFEINRLERRSTWSMNLAYLMATFWGIYFITIAIATGIVIVLPQKSKFHFIREIFNGLREPRVSKMYLIVFLTHRIILSCILVIDTSLTFKGKLGVFIGLEGMYLLYLFWAFPFLNWKDNFMVILNKCFMLTYLIPLFYYWEISKWITTFEWTFLGFLAGNWLIMSFNYFGIFLFNY